MTHDTLHITSHYMTRCASTPSSAASRPVATRAAVLTRARAAPRSGRRHRRAGPSVTPPQKNGALSSPSQAADDAGPAISVFDVAFGYGRDAAAADAAPPPLLFSGLRFEVGRPRERGRRRGRRMSARRARADLSPRASNPNVECATGLRATPPLSRAGGRAGGREGRRDDARRARRRERRGQVVAAAAALEAARAERGRGCPRPRAARRPLRPALRGAAAGPQRCRRLRAGRSDLYHLWCAYSGTHHRDPPKRTRDGLRHGLGYGETT